MRSDPLRRRRGGARGRAGTERHLSRFVRSPLPAPSPNPHPVFRVSVTPAQLRADVARRLRPAVPGMPQAEFDALVERIVAVELKYDARRLTSSVTSASPAVARPPGV